MNSLLVKEGMRGQIQMIYIDPPYGIKYGSNFQPFTNKRDVKDRSDKDLTQEPEMIKAFRDTWELGIHSYLTYLRDRLVMARELLSESGSVFVQISDDNLHYVTQLMTEVFGAKNYISLITFKKTTGSTSNLLSSVSDYIIWFSKNKDNLKYNQLYFEKEIGGRGGGGYTRIELPNLERRSMTEKEKEDHSNIPNGARVFTVDNLTSQSPGTRYNVEFQGKKFYPKGYWKTEESLMPRLIKAGRVNGPKSVLNYVRFFEDFPAFQVTNNWDDTTIFASDKKYVVETSVKVIERCILMCTDPGDLIFDPTCGSGTTAYSAEKWGRRWITCDTSRVAVALTKQRLVTASFDYHTLRYPEEGVKAGFIYETVQHITLKSIANNVDIDLIYDEGRPKIESALKNLNDALTGNPSKSFKITLGARKGKSVDFSKGDILHEWEVPFVWVEDWPEIAYDHFALFHSCRQETQRKIDQSISDHAERETLYDKPRTDNTKIRICGPFSVEAVPAPTVMSLDNSTTEQEVDETIARSGETFRQNAWIDELLTTGVRGKGGDVIHFSDFETLPGLRYIHANGYLEKTGERVVASFGPEHAALEQRQVELALTDAQVLRPTPSFILFCAFTFDPEAAKDIDEVSWPGVTLLKAQMNSDLLTKDLRNKRASNESFWLIGQPDIELRKRSDGFLEVEVRGFDYFDTTASNVVSGGSGQIAMWSLDIDYDGRSLMPNQIFFPMEGSKGGWNQLRKTVRAELNEESLEYFHGTVSLPFESGEYGRIAVKIVDDRGIESIKIIQLEG